MPTNNEDLAVKLIKANIRLNQQKFKEFERELKANREKTNEIEDLVISHSRRSIDRSQTLLLLVAGLFICILLLALLNTSIEGKIGTATIKYSSNNVLQLILTIATAGGGGVAIAQLQRIKK